MLPAVSLREPDTRYGTITTFNLVYLSKLCEKWIILIHASDQIVRYMPLERLWLRYLETETMQKWFMRQVIDWKTCSYT